MDKREQGTFEATGMLMPLLKYRWRVIFPNLSVEDGKMLTANAVRLSISYTTSELHLTIHQDLHSVTFHKIFSRMMRTTTNTISGKRTLPLGSSQTILIESLDGSNDKATTALELHCTPKSHNFLLDYTAVGDVVEHNLVFNIENVVEYEIIEKEQERAE